MSSAPSQKPSAHNGGKDKETCPQCAGTGIEGGGRKIRKQVRNASIGNNKEVKAANGNGTKKGKRWPKCNLVKPGVDRRLFRDGEHMCLSYAGHTPGERFIYGKNSPTCTTFAKRRLCTYTPYEYVDPDGCCTSCGVFS